jgi:hypothetical protein
MSVLFTAVSVEQQEIVAGGDDANISNVAITTVRGINNTTYVEQKINSIIKKKTILQGFRRYY